MGRWTRLAGLALAAACLVAVAGLARAQERREGGAGPDLGGPGPMMGVPGLGGPMMPMRGPDPEKWERLGLSDGQRRRLEDLRDVEERKLIRLEADLRIAGLDLRRLVAGERPNLQAIGMQVDRIADLRAEVMKARIATQIGMREVLTPGQRAQLRAGQPGVRPGGPGRPGLRGGGGPRRPGPRGGADGVQVAPPEPDDEAGPSGPDAR